MQWFSLAVLIIGILLVQLSSGHEERRANSNENRFVGICAAFGAALCSGFASIFFEKILKGSDVSIWMRNVQLALLSVVFGGFNCAIIDYESVAEKGFFFG
jgi:UDP-sugar transporter A1/2/3